MGFRPDICGLRAVAVLAVVLYHVGMLPGGYVGVDVFFVLSGFLIASKIGRDNFSLAAFYESRARKLLPALLVVVLASMAVAPLVLKTSSLTLFYASLPWQPVMLQNVFFWLHDDYFNQTTVKPLLHTWSLGVEASFYLIAPLLLLWRRWLVASGVLVVSLVACVVVSRFDHTFAFYMLPTRLWEFMLGAIVAMLPAQRRTWLGYAGLLAIVASAALYHKGLKYPGAYALLPCIGAALVILSRPDTWLLNVKPMQWLGDVSYSAYLWHGPIILFAGPELSWIEIVACLIATGVLAHLSWKFIERPFVERRALGSVPRFAMVGALVSVPMLALASPQARSAVQSFNNRDLAWLDVDYANYNAKLAGPWRGETCFTDRSSVAPECLARRSDRPVVMLWGDSFAAHLVPGLTGALGDSASLVQMTKSGCPSIPGVTTFLKPDCHAFNSWALKHIEQNEPADIVLIAGQWPSYFEFPEGREALKRVLVLLRERGSRVILIGPLPNYREDLIDLVREERALVFDTTKYFIPVQDIEDTASKIAEDAGVTYVSLLNALCVGRACRTEINGRLIQTDKGGHLTLEGSALAAEIIAPAIKSIH